MTLRDVTLHDRYDLSKDQVLLSGTQALVRLMLMQKARDEAAGLRTAGYVTGYRGSPLGAVDRQMAAAQDALTAHEIKFEPGLNEDLAVTALWGTQQAELRGEGTHDGVFGLWYGKGPGIDRSGDAMRHANLGGSSAHGGVLMAMGDDHTGESSTTCHHSEWAMLDAYMPVLSPAGVQEILDLGLYGYALSRFAGVWAGLKLMKDTVEVTSVVDGRPHRLQFVAPEFDMPDGGLNARLGDHWTPQEGRLYDFKRRAMQAFARANRIDRRMTGQAGAKIGFVAAGKSWLDLTHALGLLGIDEETGLRLGITTYKIAQTFPLDTDSFHDWAEGLDLIVVVEEKRKILEVQIKEAIFDDRRGRRVYGASKGTHGPELFPSHGVLDPVMVAEKIGTILVEEGLRTDGLEAALVRMSDALRADNAKELAARLPYFCSGCPHNTSTNLPEGSRAYAGIGCHTMVLWMDRETSGYTHMGAEGANWIGESAFSKRSHVFQNMGDGTYNHSGIMAIRAAVAAKTNITFKILFNDAVALTGGQAIDGDLTADKIARELLALDVGRVAVVYDPKEEPERSAFPKGLEWYERDDLDAVQQDLRAHPGVTAILYIQTCAAEKRRKRKRGTLPADARRVMINPEVCEGCGDCGVQSNCVSILPLDTPLGRKRTIDQSSCNKDFSCLKGFCPSFMIVEGGTPRPAQTQSVELTNLAEPDLPAIDGTTNLVITGIGGTGVVTIGAVLAMAAHLDGRAASMMEMAGLAQKGGAVHIHCRLANTPGDISAIRVAAGECDTLIGGDLVVSAGARTLGLMAEGRTGAVVNSHEVMTGAFTRDTDFQLPSEQLALSLQARMGDGLTLLDTYQLAKQVMGDTIYANMIVLGACWQKALVPLTRAAIMRAIELNGADPEANKKAFDLGRWAILNPDEAEALQSAQVIAVPATAEEIEAHRRDHLIAYQGPRLARRYTRLLERIEEPELRRAVAQGYHKVLTYKDEYEVARLLMESRTQAEEAFEGDVKVTYHLAPPILGGLGKDGRPKKRQFGAWTENLFPILARLKRLRGTPLDLFGYTTERRMERQLIRAYEADIERLLTLPERASAAGLALAELPLRITGFGPVKAEKAAQAEQTRTALWKTLEAGGPNMAQAAE